MLARLPHAGCSLAPTCNRGYASIPTSLYPFKKLRAPSSSVRHPVISTFSTALPFVMTPETAQRKMAQHAQLLCGGKYHIRSQIAPLLPPELDFLKFDFKRPTNFFAAAYFPAWSISGTFDAKIRFKDNRVLRAFFLSFSSGSRGSDVQTLSAASLWPESVWDTNPTVPFTEALLKQHDMDVQAIPFNVSPFSFLDVIQSSPERDITFDRGGKLVPSSVNVSDFTAMPVLLPLYVATYEDERHNSENFLTMFVQAHSTEGLVKADQRHVLEFLSLNDFNAEDVPENYSLIEGHDVCDIDGFDRRSMGHLNLIVPLGGYDLNFTKGEIEVYMMKMFSNTENIRKLASMRSLDNDDDDERIREMSIKEVEARFKWIDEMDQKIEKAYKPNPNQQNATVSKKDVWARYGRPQTKKDRRR